jgi:uncharacterized sulfatase
MIFTDQQRADTIGFRVNNNPVTPHLDKLAQEGVKCTNAFSCQPVCGPARACLQTGTYATENGVFRNGIALDRQPQNAGRTLATWLSNGGYEVGYIGKWHLASNGGRADFDIGIPERYTTAAIPLHLRGGYTGYWLAADALEHTSHGYNGMPDASWGGEPQPPGYMFDRENRKVEFVGYRVDAQTDFILDFLSTRNGDRPWFLFTSFIEPHHQNDHDRYEGPAGSKERFAITKDHVPKDLWGAEWLKSGDWEKNYADYLGQCWSLDHNVGRIVDRLKALGIYENTLIIYTSDHGSHFHTREGEYKRNCTDGCLHVPLIFRGPGFVGGIQLTQLISLVDVVPTILAAAGIHIPAHLRGRPIHQLLQPTPPADWPDYIFAQISESQVGRCIRTERWKYSVRAPAFNGRDYSRSKLYMEEFLFDLHADPHELVNLIESPDHAPVRKALATTLIRQMVNIGEPAPLILPAMQIPDPPIAAESGILVDIPGEGLALRLQEKQRAAGFELVVPIAELLDEILNVLIILECGADPQTGRLTLAEIGELWFDASPSDSNSQKPLRQLLSSMIGSKVHLLVLFPPKGKIHSASKESPRYYVLFQHE